MTDATAEAAAIHMARDRLRRDPLPFAADCEHDIELLPTVDFCIDFSCRKCEGFRSFYGSVLNGVNMDLFWSLDGAGQLALLAGAAPESG